MCKILKINQNPKPENVVGMDSETMEKSGLSQQQIAEISDAEFEDLMKSMMNDLADVGSDRFQFLQEIKASRDEGKLKKVCIYDSDWTC